MFFHFQFSLDFHWHIFAQISLFQVYIPKKRMLVSDRPLVVVQSYEFQQKFPSVNPNQLHRANH
jgi:hypothetical protein